MRQVALVRVATLFLVAFVLTSNATAGPPQESGSGATSAPRDAGRYQGKLVIPFAAMRAETKGPRVVYHAEVSSDGAVNGDADWQSSGEPSMIAVMVAKVARKKAYTDVELRETGPLGRVVQLRFAFPGDTNELFERLVIAAPEGAAPALAAGDTPAATPAPDAEQGRHEGVFVIPVAAMESEKKGAGTVYHAHVSQDGGVNNNRDWRLSGPPSMIAVSVAKVTRKKTYTDVELREMEAPGRIVRLRFAFAGDTSDSFERLVIDASEKDSYLTAALAALPAPAPESPAVPAGVPEPAASAPSAAVVEPAPAAVLPAPAVTPDPAVAAAPAVERAPALEADEIVESAAVVAPEPLAAPAPATVPEPPPAVAAAPVVLPVAATAAPAAAPEPAATPVAVVSPAPAVAPAAPSTAVPVFDGKPVAMPAPAVTAAPAVAPPAPAAAMVPAAPASAAVPSVSPATVVPAASPATVTSSRTKPDSGDRHEGMLVVPLAAMRVDPKSARPVYYAEVSANGAVDGSREWKLSGLPPMLALKVTKVTRKKDYTDVELREPAEGGAVVRLRFTFAGDASEAFERLVIDAGAKDAYLDSVYAALAPVMLTGSLAKLPEAAQVQLVRFVDAEGISSRVREEHYKGSRYVTLDMGRYATEFDPLKMNQTARAARVLNDRLLPAVKAFASVADAVQSHGLKLELALPHRRSGASSPAARTERLALYAPAEAVRKYGADEITKQQFIELSMVVVDGDWISVPMSVLRN